LPRRAHCRTARRHAATRLPVAKIVTCPPVTETRSREPRRPVRISGRWAAHTACAGASQAAPSPVRTSLALGKVHSDTRRPRRLRARSPAPSLARAPTLCSNSVAGPALLLYPQRGHHDRPARPSQRQQGPRAARAMRPVATAGAPRCGWQAAAQPQQGPRAAVARCVATPAGAPRCCSPQGRVPGPACGSAQPGRSPALGPSGAREPQLVPRERDRADTVGTQSCCAARQPCAAPALIFGSGAADRRQRSCHGKRIVM
jgi:hypothetical protein